MLAGAIPFPAFDPVAIAIGPLEFRWYGLAYMAGLLFAWWYARRLLLQPPLWGGRARLPPDDLDNLIVLVTLGIVLGGRLGYVLFYNIEHYLLNPQDIFKLWHGGMSFHGGLAGAAAALYGFALYTGTPAMGLFDLASAVAPMGLLLGRIANFINGELWGRASDVSWAMVFPNAGPLPRHPSQLYEAATEGALLFVVLVVVCQRGGLKRPGLVSGVFGIGYALARIFCEFFREPDPQLGFLLGGAMTMGMLLSLPVLSLGIWLLLRAGADQNAPSRN